MHVNYTSLVVTLLESGYDLIVVPLGCCVAHNGLSIFGLHGSLKMTNFLPGREPFAFNDGTEQVPEILPLQKLSEVVVA